MACCLPPGLSVKASCGTASHCCHVAVQWLFSKFRFHHSKSPACISAPQGMMWACKKTQPTWQDALRQLDPSCLSYILKRSAERIRRPRRKCNSFRQPKMFCTTKYRTEQVYSWVENFLQCSSAVLPHAYIHIHIYICIHIFHFNIWCLNMSERLGFGLEYFLSGMRQGSRWKAPRLLAVFATWQHLSHSNADAQMVQQTPAMYWCCPWSSFINPIVHDVGGSIAKHQTPLQGTPWTNIYRQ